MPAGPAPHSSAAQSNITRARSMLCGRYAPSHAGHGGTLGACCCRTCRAPNISSKILWKCPAVGRAAAAARRADSASGRPRRDARPRRPPRPGHAPRRRRRRPPPTSTPDGNRSDPEGARRRPTAPARSEAEPRTRTAARPPASAATRSRPPRPPPPPRAPASGPLAAWNLGRIVIELVAGPAPVGGARASALEHLALPGHHGARARLAIGARVSARGAHRHGGAELCHAGVVGV
jgi:hypothetical protein